MNMKEQVLDIPSQDVITRDNAMVHGRRRDVLPGAGRRRAAYEVANLSHRSSSSP